MTTWPEPLRLASNEAAPLGLLVIRQRERLAVQHQDGGAGHALAHRSGVSLEQGVDLLTAATGQLDSAAATAELHPGWRRRLRQMPHLAGAAVAVAVLAGTGVANAQGAPGVVVETVNTYKPCFGTGTNLPNSNADGNNFITELLSGSNEDDYYVLYHYEDGNVWDSDFLDPELNPGNGYDDTDNFDPQVGAAISFFAGHGLGMVGNGQTIAQTCETEAGCSSPPVGTWVGTSGYGTCVQSPQSWAKYGTGEGVCYYTPNPASSGPQILVCGNTVTNNNTAPLYPYMGFGETSSTGSWRGAGENGGVSLAIVHMSDGLWTFFPGSEWAGIFAGLQLYAGVMISWGDVTGGDSVFGEGIADYYVANPEGEVEQAYVDAITTDNEGDGCGGSGMPAGGINGCGCHMIETISGTSYGAELTFAESWADLSYTSSFQDGTGYWYWNVGCNYNPSTYPWQGGG